MKNYAALHRLLPALLVASSGSIHCEPTPPVVVVVTPGNAPPPSLIVATATSTPTDDADGGTRVLHGRSRAAVGARSAWVF
jgi:hypothetical protein